MNSSTFNAVEIVSNCPSVNYLVINTNRINFVLYYI